jgi:hypothetical protein
VATPAQSSEQNTLNQLLAHLALHATTLGSNSTLPMERGAALRQAVQEATTAAKAHTANRGSRGENEKAER